MKELFLFTLLIGVFLLGLVIYRKFFKKQTFEKLNILLVGMDSNAKTNHPPQPTGQKPEFNKSEYTKED